MKGVKFISLEEKDWPALDDIDVYEEKSGSKNGEENDKVIKGNKDNKDDDDDDEWRDKLINSLDGNDVYLYGFIYYILKPFSELMTRGEDFDLFERVMFLIDYATSQLCAIDHKFDIHGDLNRGNFLYKIINVEDEKTKRSGESEEVEGKEGEKSELKKIILYVTDFGITTKTTSRISKCKGILMIGNLKKMVSKSLFPEATVENENKKKENEEEKRKLRKRLSKVFKDYDDSLIEEISLKDKEDAEDFMKCEKELFEGIIKNCKHSLRVFVKGDFSEVLKKSIGKGSTGFQYSMLSIKVNELEQKNKEQDKEILKLKKKNQAQDEKIKELENKIDNLVKMMKGKGNCDKCGGTGKLRSNN